MYYYGPMMSGDGWIGGIFMMIFWFGLLILLAYVVLRLFRGHDINVGQKRDPLDIAKERYAKGELTKEQFDQLKQDLGA